MPLFVSSAAQNSAYSSKSLKDFFETRTLLPLPVPAEKEAFALADLYDRDLELAAREAYGRDYTAFGFGDWR